MAPTTPPLPPYKYWGTRGGWRAREEREDHGDAAGALQPEEQGEEADGYDDQGAATEVDQEHEEPAEEWAVEESARGLLYDLLTCAQVDHIEPKVLIAAQTLLGL